MTVLGLERAPAGGDGRSTSPGASLDERCSVCFTTRLLSGSLQISSETKEVRFVPLERLNDLNIHPSMRLRIEHYIDQRSQPYIG